MARESIFDSFKKLVVDKDGNMRYVENNNLNNQNSKTMATKKSTSKKATTKRATKKATKKVAPKTKKHALIIQVSEKNGDCKNEFTFHGDLDIVAMAISKQAHADENFRAFFYYLIKNVGKHSEKILKATKTKTRAKAKK